MSKQTHLLRKGDQAYHLLLGLVGDVQHVSPRHGGMVLLRHADGRERSYPVSELYAHDPTIDDITAGWNVPCRVE